jgi:tetratricopeptide (TPR) repeat protein
MRLVPALLVLLLAGVVAVRAGQWFENYENGRIALRENRYAEAVRYLSDAIDQRPESKASARTYGVRFADYFPYLYRGIAYMRLGKGGLALEDFKTEDRFGEVRQAQYDTKAQQLLEDQMGSLTAHIAEREKTESGTPGDPARNEASSPVALVPVRTHMDSVFDQAAGELGRGQLTSAKKLFADVERASRGYPGLADHLKTIRSRELEIRRGIGAYLRGEYKNAIDVLTPMTTGAADVSSLHAFLGCSYSALYLLSGEEESALHVHAQEAFRRVKGIDAHYALDRNFVSPGIRRVYEAVPQP